MSSAFEVLTTKSLSGDVVSMAWCPKMDLIALVTSDSQLMVHRPAKWQRLFAHTGFDHPVTCLGWRPDGQILAVGHANGSISLFGVEEGEQLGGSHVHTDSLCTFCWVAASPGDTSPRNSLYASSLAGIFAPLPQLPKLSAIQQNLLEEGTPQLDVALYKLLFEPQTSLAFDIAVTADSSARVHLAVHGRFSLGTVQITELPSLRFASMPTLLDVRLDPSLHALTVVVLTSGPTQAILPDGGKQEHKPGTLVLAFRTGQLTRSRVEIRALALAFMQCEALATRARGGLEVAQKVWSDAVAPLHSKMKHLASELEQTRGANTVAEQLLVLLACGVPSAHVQGFFNRELREADLSKTVKALAFAANALTQLLVTQVQPALDMLVQRLSHLEGLSKWPYHFKALGLQPETVSEALQAAASLRATAELLLVSMRRSQPDLSCFMCWLIRIQRKLRDESPPASDELPPLNMKAVGAFLLASSKRAGGLPLDLTSEIFTSADGVDGAASPTAVDDDELSRLAPLPPTRHVPEALDLLDRVLQAAFSPIAQHVSAEITLHSCASLDDAAEEDVDGKQHVLVDMVEGAESDGRATVGEKEAAATEGSGGSELDGGEDAASAAAPLTLLAMPRRESCGLTQAGVQLVLARASWGQGGTAAFVWEAAAVGRCEAPLTQAKFYKQDHLTLLHRAPSGATTVAVRPFTDFDFTPLPPPPASAVAVSLLDQVPARLCSSHPPHPHRTLTAPSPHPLHPLHPLHPPSPFSPPSPPSPPTLTAPGAPSPPTLSTRPATSPSRCMQ